MKLDIDDDYEFAFIYWFIDQNFMKSEKSNFVSFFFSLLSFFANEAKSLKASKAFSFFVYFV